jgi:hypothetical protein
MNTTTQYSLSASPEIQNIKSTVSLASAALLVRVEVNTWTATKQDRAVSNEITASKNATADSARVTKLLLSHSPQHKALLNYRQTVYNWMQLRTHDWAGDWRVLPVYKLEEFNREYAAHEVEFRKLLDAFLAVYPSLISDAAFKHGGLFDVSEYPDIETVRGKFRLNKFVTTVPKDDFRVAVADAVADDLKQQYEAQLNNIVDGVMQDMKKRLVTYATRLRDACEEVKAEADAEAKSGKVKRRKIYETTFDNVKSVVDMLRNFNLTDDPELVAAADKLSAIMSNTTLNDLRESAFTRSEVRDDLNDVLSKFAPINLSDDENDE